MATAMACVLSLLPGNNKALADEQLFPNLPEPSPDKTLKTQSQPRVLPEKVILPVRYSVRYDHRFGPPLPAEHSAQQDEAQMVQELWPDEGRNPNPLDHAPNRTPLNTAENAPAPAPAPAPSQLAEEVSAPPAPHPIHGGIETPSVEALVAEGVIPEQAIQPEIPAPMPAVAAQAEPAAEPAPSVVSAAPIHTIRNLFAENFTKKEAAEAPQAAIEPAAKNAAPEVLVASSDTLSEPMQTYNAEPVELSENNVSTADDDSRFFLPWRAQSWMSEAYAMPIDPKPQTLLDPTLPRKQDDKPDPIAALQNAYAAREENAEESGESVAMVDDAHTQQLASLSPAAGEASQEVIQLAAADTTATDTAPAALAPPPPPLPAASTAAATPNTPAAAPVADTALAAPTPPSVVSAPAPTIKHKSPLLARLGAQKPGAPLMPQQAALAQPGATPEQNPTAGTVLVPSAPNAPLDLSSSQSAPLVAPVPTQSTPFADKTDAAAQELLAVAPPAPFIPPGVKLAPGVEDKLLPTSAFPFGDPTVLAQAPPAPSEKTSDVPPPNELVFAEALRGTIEKQAKKDEEIHADAQEAQEVLQPKSKANSGKQKTKKKMPRGKSLYEEPPELAYDPATHNEPPPQLSRDSRKLLSKIDRSLAKADQGNEGINAFDIERARDTDKLFAGNQSSDNNDRRRDGGLGSARSDEMGIHVGQGVPRINNNYELEKAYNALAAGQNGIAIDIYRNVISSEPNNTLALFGLATSYHRAGQIDAARPLYAKILQLEPNNRDALNNFLVLLADEAPEEALLQMEKLETRNPGFSPIPAQMAVLYQKMNKLDQAMQKMLRAVGLEPENLTYRYNLAILMDKQGKSEEAANLYKQLISAYQKGAVLPGNVQAIQERLTFLRSNH